MYTSKLLVIRDPSLRLVTETCNWVAETTLTVEVTLPAFMDAVTATNDMDTLDDVNRNRVRQLFTDWRLGIPPSAH